jgi:hypothetical protein
MGINKFALVIPTELPEFICIHSEVSDHNALEMIAVGHLHFDPDDLTLDHVASLKDESPFLAALTEEMVKRKYFGPGDGSVFKLYCYTAETLPDPRQFVLWAGVHEPLPDNEWATDELRGYASKIIGMRRVKLANIAAKEALGIPCDEEYASFLTLQSEVQLPRGLLETVSASTSVAGNSNGKSFSDSPSAPASEEVLQAFLARFNIDKAIYEKLIRPATKQEQTP